MIFVTAWNSRHNSDSDYLFFLGIAYLFVGIIDLVHLLSFNGMNIFTSWDSHQQTQLRLGARFIQSLSLFAAPFFSREKFSGKILLLLLLTSALFLLSSVFLFQNLPVALGEGSFLSPFKRVRQYTICGIFVFAVFSTGKIKETLGYPVYALIILSLCSSAASELLLTFNTDVHGIFNLSGHLVKILSFYFVYKVMIEMTLVDPFNSLFKEIQNRDRSHRDLIDQFPLPMMITRERSYIEFMNKSFIDLFGYTLDDIQDVDKWWEILVPDVKYRAEKRKTLNTGIDKALESRGNVPILELLLTGKNGVVHHCNLSIVYVEGLALSVIHDVTDRIRVERERKQLEEMVLRNEKMLSLGRLSAGTAHEINNPLAGMMQTLYVLNKRILGKSDNKANVKAAEESGIAYESIVKYMEKRSIPRMIDSINNAGQRISNIVDNMLFFAKDDKLQKSATNLGKLIDKTVEIACTDSTLKEIEIVKQFDPHLPLVFCVTSRIQQVILNVLRNSTQALTESSTAHPSIKISLHYLEDSKEAQITISDNGPGMSAGVRKNIFEPFYTTREVGSGSGLGLSVSYFIITETHKGRIGVNTHPGKGAEFVITIPIS